VTVCSYTRHYKTDVLFFQCDDPVYGGVGAPDSGENYGPAPDLDHTNPELRITLKRWMRWLVDDVGFGGFRFDFVRG
jgi:alpha-amylase|tara:strand:+ start:442 stop:672 length:231 start_codon:yes stop_codon:yes gene_type:complete